MSESRAVRSTGSGPRFPAEVLYMIAAYCFPTWSDHDLWFGLGHSTHVLRDAVADHVRKGLRDKELAFHTRLEKHCKGNIIRDVASANRIETYLSQPVAVQSEAPTGDELLHDSPLRHEGDDGHVTAGNPTIVIARTWELDIVGAQEPLDPYTAVFKTTCDVGDTDQDLSGCTPARQLRTMASIEDPDEQESKQLLAPNSDTISGQPKETVFFCKALSRETAETGKIDFDNVRLTVRWVKAPVGKMDRSVRGRVFTVGIDWREIWSKKLGRERYCQRRYAEKQQEAQRRRREQMGKIAGTAVLAM